MLIKYLIKVLCSHYLMLPCALLCTKEVLYSVFRYPVSFSLPKDTRLIKTYSIHIIKSSLKVNINTEKNMNGLFINANVSVKVNINHLYFHKPYKYKEWYREEIHIQ